jgi:hypothetical protein
VVGVAREKGGGGGKGDMAAGGEILTNIGEGSSFSDEKSNFIGWS